MIEEVASGTTPLCSPSRESASVAWESREAKAHSDRVRLDSCRPFTGGLKGGRLADGIGGEAEAETGVELRESSRTLSVGCNDSGSMDSSAKDKSGAGDGQRTGAAEPELDATNSPREEGQVI